MDEFEKLRKAYITAINFAILTNLDYDEIKNSNELLHKFCENLIDSSNYSELEKRGMKQSLMYTKEILSKEIEYKYKA